MAAAAQLAGVVGEIDVVVTAERGLAGPFVAQKSDEAAILVAAPGDLLALLPVGAGQQKAIALMSGEIRRCKVACEREVVGNGLSTAAIGGLGVQVTPVEPMLRLRNASDRIGDSREALGAVGHLDAMNTFGQRSQPQPRHGA